MFCTPSRAQPRPAAPSRAEIAGIVPARQSRGTDGKVIYSAHEDAEAAARELETLGARCLRAYLCGRSRGGRFHLATDTPVATTPPRHLRIPRQRLSA